MANLTEAWTNASASLPIGWELAGIERWGRPAAVVPGRPDIELPGDRSWRAWARTDGGQLEAFGANPPSALLALARKLAELRGDPNGGP